MSLAGRLLVLLALAGPMACSSPSPDSRSLEYSDEEYERNAIVHRDTLSAASKRALERGYGRGPEWYCEFRTHDLKGDFAYEEGVTRRDPSAVITVNGTYYVYYSRGTGKTYGFGTGDPEKKVFPWDKTEIWYATSTDGWEWKEEGRAVGRGPTGAFDDRSVFTPEVLAVHPPLRRRRAPQPLRLSPPGSESGRP